MRTRSVTTDDAMRSEKDACLPEEYQRESKRLNRDGPAAIAATANGGCRKTDWSVLRRKTMQITNTPKNKVTNVREKHEGRPLCSAERMIWRPGYKISASSVAREMRQVEPDDYEEQQQTTILKRRVLESNKQITGILSSKPSFKSRDRQLCPVW